MVEKALSNYNFGDCEIRSISFSDDCATIRIFDPTESRFIEIEFQKLYFLRFETSHWQNVIDSIVLFDSILSLDKSPVTGIFLYSLPDSMPDDARAAYVRPITGGECLILFQDLECRYGKENCN